MAVTRVRSHETFYGTAADMAAFTSAAQGDIFKQTDTGEVYVLLGAAWVVDVGDKIAAGASVIGAAATLAHTVATIGATTGAALAANAARTYVLLVNDSDSAIYIKIGAAAVLNQGIRLNAYGGSYEMSVKDGNLDTRAINAISSGAGKVLLVTEGV
jgi:hypothetical protein